MRTVAGAFVQIINDIAVILDFSFIDQEQRQQTSLTPLITTADAVGYSVTRDTLRQKAVTTRNFSCARHCIRLV